MKDIMNFSSSVPYTHHEEMPHSELDEPIDKVSFFGHVVPGLVFLILGLWWAYCSFYRYFLCSRDAKLRENSRPFIIGTSYNSKLSKWFPIEATAGVGLSLVGLIIEAFHKTVQEFILHNMLYLSYQLWCILELLRCRGYGVNRRILYLMMCITLFGNFMLILGHVNHPNSPFITKMHYRLLLIIAEGITLICVEIYNANNIVSCFCRAHFFISFGLWWITIGHLITPIYTDRLIDDTHKSLVLIDIIFVAEMYMSLFLISVLAAVAYLKVHKLRVSQLAAELDYEFTIDDYLLSLKSVSKYRHVMTDECKKPLLPSSDEDCCSIKSRYLE